ncbi:hypothetical protein FGRMN_4533 [Fusarium graminum]|nr:hypothetical protein FGRMN_4533 [Fusarium graminum]
MPKKPPPSLGRSANLKTPPATARRPAPSRQSTYHGPPTPTYGGPQKPPPGTAPSVQRTRSHEAASRRPRYPPTSTPRQLFNERPKRRESGFRSVSPRTRPPPPLPVQRGFRRRVTRESDWMSEDESRPSSRRGSPEPSRAYRPDRGRPQGHQTPPWPTSPNPPTGVRPPLRAYPTDSSRPNPRRFHSYEPPRVQKQPPGTGQRSPPPGYRPASHLAADMLRGRPRSKVESPLSSYETLQTPDKDRKPDTGPAKPQPAPRKQPVKSERKQEDKPPEKPKKEQPQKKGFDFLKHLPQAFATHAGVEALGQHADTAKEWTDWFMEMRKTPEEIHELCAKATTAKDTITQIQNTLKVRPDIIDGDNALPIRIDDSIKNATTALDEMTKLLQEISSDGLDGGVLGGLEEFYNSYKYKNEWEEKIKLADADLEKQLAALNKLMVNIYSSALLKPAPPGLDTPVPPPAPGKTSDSPGARHPSTTGHRPKSSAGSTGLDPPPIGKFRKLVDEDADNSAPAEPTDLKSEPSKDTRTEGPSATHVEQDEGDRKTDGDENAKVPPTETPKVVKPKVDDGADEVQIPSPASESGQPASEEAAKKEEPTGAKPLKPTPVQEKTSLLPTPPQDPGDLLLDAAWNGDTEACSKALRIAPPSTRDHQGLTPLHLAAERDHLAIAMLLLDLGAPINARANSGRTPLHLAARYSSAALVEYLVDDGHADVNARTTDGRTPLHYAASAAEDGDDERREVIRVLRDWKADPTIQDNKGKTPRDVAQKRDFWDVSSTLRRAEKRWEEEHHQNWFQRHGLKR